MTTPKYRVDSSPLAGAPYRVHTITLADGRVVRSQLSPYGAGEAEQHVRDYLLAAVAPPPAPVTFERGTGKPTRAKPGPKPGAKGRRGEAWRDHSWIDREGDA